MARHKPHRTENIVVLLVILVAIGGVAYLWQAYTGPGRSIEGLRALAEIYAKRAQTEGGPELEMPMMVRQQQSLEPCCCIRVDPNGVKRDHTALYWMRGDCVCYPELGWQPTETYRCPGAPRTR